MISPDKLCPGCFQQKENTSACPHCRYDESSRRSRQFLPYRTVLHGQYLVGRSLGNPGGFGITYLARDLKLDINVAIKEFFPRGVVERDSDGRSVCPQSDGDDENYRYGLDAFLKEARTLAQFDHSNIVRVRTFFEEHGTAYLVMDYLQGHSLAEYVGQKRAPLSEKEALDIMMPVLDGLREVHGKGFLHRDIKPQNIYIRTDGRPMLLDFGAARFAMSDHSQTLTVVLTPGFAPFEQYHRKGKQGPWTDIYAVAATLYFLVTGHVPPEATDRVKHDEFASPNSILPSVSGEFSHAVSKALSPEASERPQSVDDFCKLLNPIIPKRMANAIEELLATSTSGIAQQKEIGRDERFIAYDNGTVLDTRTGLMWAAHDNGCDINWDSAKQYCESYTGGGHCDWRMPTISELQSLHDTQYSQNTERGFLAHLTSLIHLTRTLVWSSETSDASDAQRFDFRYGTATSSPRSYSSCPRALPVRSRNAVQEKPHQAQKAKEKSGKRARSVVPKDRELIIKEPVETAREGHFIAYSDGTVTDSRTGLMWATRDNGNDINWDDAKRYCENYSGGGHNDWRMPTISELQSLHDTQYSQNTERGYLVQLTSLIHLTCTVVWSSETSDPSNARGFNFINGFVGSRPRSYSNINRALPVRSR